MSRYILNADQDTVHWSFHRDDAPILTIQSGDSVVYRTLDAGGGLEQIKGPGQVRARIEKVRPGRTGRGHCLVGPVAIEGAEPGMTLAVRINEVRVGSYGFTSAGKWPNEQNKRLGLTEVEELTLLWDLDGDKSIGRNQFGQMVALRPFMGVMGMPADVADEQSTFPPRFTGGNLDCKELVPGSILYLPIAVKGGLFSVGDGHAVQGNGEVSCQAIECPMEKVDLTFTLEDNMPLKNPRANTPEGWLTFGLHENLEEAMWLALDDMLNLMSELYDIPRVHAMALASTVVDLRVTQIVNGVKGVHAVLPHGAIR